MDDFLIWVVLAIVYFIFSALTSKKKKPAAPPPAGQPPSGPASGPVTSPDVEPTLDDALREIRIALGMEPPPPAPAPSPPKAEPPPIQVPPRQPTHSVRSHGPELAETAPKKSWSSEFRPIPTRYADSDFEELRSRDGDRFGQRQQKPTPTPAKPAPVYTSRKQAPTGVHRSRIMQQLNDTNAAREAFILSEIFGPPHANRRR